jgi:hypothetical protein
LAVHAVVVHVELKDLAEAKRGLEEQIIPMQKQAPGFKGAYFIDLGDGHGMSVQAWDTEEQAKAGAPPEGAEAPGVTLGSVQFGEVIASA